MYKSFSAVAVAVSVALTAAGEATAPAGAAIPSARFYDGVGDEVRSLVAGNVLTLELTLPRESDEPTAYRLVLLPEEVEVAVCDLPVAVASCRTGDIDTLGWAWSVTGERLPTRHLELWKAGEVLARFELDVTPRPVVLVHGFTATAATWNSYGGPDGFLADLGVEAYAVGDPSLGPTLNMGRTTDPTAVTNTVAENAAVLGAVIDAVRARTRADMVDVVAHSMGGLVARYYLSRLMEARSVGQLL